MGVYPDSLDGLNPNGLDPELSEPGAVSRGSRRRSPYARRRRSATAAGHHAMPPKPATLIDRIVLAVIHDVRLYHEGQEHIPALVVSSEQRYGDTFSVMLRGRVISVAKNEPISSSCAWDDFRITSDCYKYRPLGDWKVGFPSYGNGTMQHLRPRFRLLKLWEDYIQTQTYRDWSDWLRCVLTAFPLPVCTVDGHQAITWVPDPIAHLDRAYKAYLATNPTLTAHQKARLLADAGLPPDREEPNESEEPES